MKPSFLSKILLAICALIGMQAYAANAYCYFDNSQNWNVKVWAWNSANNNANCNANGQWPGDPMTEGPDGVLYWEAPAGKTPNMIIFSDNGGTKAGGDLTFVNGATYYPDGSYRMIDYGPIVEKPVVTASPESGTRFKDDLTVTLTSSMTNSVIYYTLDGTEPTVTSPCYTSPLTLTETTTVKAFALTTDNVKGNTATFTYTKRSAQPVQNGNSLNTDYYRVNPDGKTGSNRTVNAKFTRLNNDNRMCVADNALTNWTDDDLICQGVARDIASAFRGRHEYPVIDSYAIYAAYDSENLYLGVQYVYTVWDLYGDGKDNNGRSKPYQMDGRIMIAFDLDPDLSFEGILENGNTIWDADGQYNTFNNGTDCIWLGSTKSTSGTPGLFFPTPAGQASYASPYCKSISAPFYGCADGLLPSIKHIWGQADFGYDPEELKGNDGFVDLIDEIDPKYHTFYEWKFPLATLGITESYIKNEGIGVMVIDTYGQGAIGCTPYDPTVFDNAAESYSKDPSSSKEKEDKDIFTYSLARIGNLGNASVDNISVDPADNDCAPRYYNLQGVEISNPTPGLYIVARGSHVTKEIVR